jgi:hypothetical protein
MVKIIYTTPRDVTPCVHQGLARNGYRGSGTVAKGQRLDDSDKDVSAVREQKFADDNGWSGAGSHRRPSAFQPDRFNRREVPAGIALPALGPR